MSASEDLGLAAKSESKKRTKCRFPIARIKKIMQFDDEIGKVSSSAPIVISHAIEMFLVDLLLLLQKRAEERSSKKIVPSDLEVCFREDSKFDFLKHLVQHLAQRVPLDKGANRKR